MIINVLSCIVMKQIEPAELLQEMANLLQVSSAEEAKAGVCQGIVVKEVVTATRVPVLKLLDTVTNLEVGLGQYD